MSKRILGMSLFGIIGSEEPWRRAHEIGMKELAERAGMPELVGMGQGEEYFGKIREALGKIDEYKDFSEGERVKRRRKQYFERVLDLIHNGDYIDRDYVAYVRTLLDEYNLVIVTTNTRNFVDRILMMTEAEDLFVRVYCSRDEEEDDKRVVFGRAVDGMMKPNLFVGSERSGEICGELGIEFIKYEGVDKLRRVLG